MGKVIEPEGSQRGKITDCRVQSSPRWARCMTAFLYGENIFRWTGRLGGNGLSSIENKVKVEKEGQGGGKAEEKGGGYSSAPNDILCRTH